MCMFSFFLSSFFLFNFFVGRRIWGGKALGAWDFYVSLLNGVILFKEILHYRTVDVFLLFLLPLDS